MLRRRLLWNYGGLRGHPVLMPREVVMRMFDIVIEPEPIVCWDAGGTGRFGALGSPVTWMMICIAGWTA